MSAGRTGDPVLWPGRRVLVSGAQGFIGSWLTERLLDLGAEVVVPSFERPERSRYAEAGLERRCIEVSADLADYSSLERLLAEYPVSAVFHLGAQTIVGIANAGPLPTYEANVAGTYNLLEACRLAGGIDRVVVASSDKAYGRHDQLPYREDAALIPTFPYDVSKACADLIARSYHASFGLPVAVTRFANVYGGGDFAWSRIVPETARALVEGRAPVLRSDGSPERDFMYVEDAVDAYLAIAAALDRDDVAGQAFNAGAGQPVPVIEVVRRLIAVAGADVEPELRGEGTPPREIDCQWLDTTRISERLGWRPAWTLERGLEATWAWYAEHLSAAAAS